MSTFITTIHIIVAVILMISVLLQTGKGSGMGAAFGGSSSSVFGSRGPATFVSRVTAVAAVVFMITSFTLSIYAQGANRRGSVIVDDGPPSAAATVPVDNSPVTEADVQIPVSGPAGSTPAADPASAPAAPDGALAPADPAPAAGSEGAAATAGDAASSSDDASPAEAPAGDGDALADGAQADDAPVGTDAPPAAE
ncbi:MAG: preprotein translocase subunit SecG [Deltaproteobacteria bacterium]|jgi:preprotein translocase subunit SecG|nr:preprotein translocase subunit SecG [Deltaproteobacteria bacterium]